MSASSHPVAGQPRPRGPSQSPLAEHLRWGAVLLTGLVVLYRPIVSGAGTALAGGAAFGLLLLLAGLLWLGSGLLRGEFRVRSGRPGLAFCAFMAAALASAVLAQNRFAALEWWWLLATYGLTAFLVLQLADREPERRFFVSCLLASAVALAAYALWHYALYMPALRTWLAAEPDFFQSAVGAAGPIAKDLAARVAADRAYGSFITSNQLSDFVVLCFFPLAAVAGVLWRRQASGRRARPARAAVCMAAALLLAIALYLSRSKGGWIAFGFGLALVGLAAGRRFVLRHPAQSLLATAVLVLVVVLVLARWRGALPSPQEFARSLGVRLGYWQTSAEMALKRPAFGVGPGNWPEWYAMLKKPEFEETKSAHSLYFQLWAETGTAGLLLFAALWVAVLAQALGRVPAAQAPEPQRASRAAERRLIAASLGMAAAALVFDYAMLGTFSPPEHVPAWLAAAPFLPYVLVYVVWTVVFLVIFGAPLADGSSLPAWGLAAGLAVFLLHSAGEFTLEVPAIGGTAAVLAALLLTVNPTEERRVALKPRACALAFAACAAVVAFWSIVVTGHALDAALSADAAEALEARGGRGPRARTEDVTAELRRACAAVPWDDKSWRNLAAWVIRPLRGGQVSASSAEAVEASRRATELNPLNASNWALLGEVQSLSGDLRAAALSYHRAAQLYPSLPEAWYRYGVALEAAGAMPAEAATAYGRALELMPRQYHQRNLFLGPPGELLALWRSLTGGAPRPLLAVAEDLAARAGGVATPAGATDAQAVARLTKGLPGGAELARKWDAPDAGARGRGLWDVLGGRLWEWALKEKLGALGAAGARREVGAGDGT